MILLAVCCAAVSGWLWFPGTRRPGPPSARRAPGQGETSRVGWLVESPLARAGICAAGLGLLGHLLAGRSGAVVAVPVGLALAVWIGRLEPPSAARAREEVERDLPLAVELLAACADVGRAPQESLALVSRAVGAALGQRLSDVTARLALGADPIAEWKRLSRDPQLADLGRTLLRSAEHGAPLAESLTRLAADRRRQRRAVSQQRARSVGVKAAGPLAVCFLPAFMLVGVVPTIAGGFQHLLG